LSLSSRFGRSAMLCGQGLHGFAAGGGHGAGHGAGHGVGQGAGVQPQSLDGRLNRAFSLSNNFGLSQPHAGAAPHGLHPAPGLTTTGGWCGGIGAGSAPAIAADEMIRNTAFKTTLLVVRWIPIPGQNCHYSHRRY
jgi:hypothetical protein